ncbi:MAG: acetylneuraminic acid synthetase, partial [Microbacteriaceae bacterium]|nr:acetylneuraminic acid synthetase [Microbacteriaceae bacterium]
MIIERTLTPYTVFGDEPVLAALQKITANRERIVFCVDHHGALTGSLSDGDFRRWLLADPTAPLDAPVSAAANANVRAYSIDAPAAELSAQFQSSRGISHLPLVDARGRLVAVAIDRADVLRIGEHRIGPDEPTFVIAEIGNNHQGDPELARRLVDLAVEAGADAVKFQLRDMDALYRQAGAQTAGEDMGAQYTLDLLSRFSLGADELLPVLAHARAAGVAVMCTPWDLPSSQVLADDGIDGMKIASADLTNHDLIADAGGRGIPLVLSTGMSREEEIVETVELLQRLGSSYALLHCQSTYPAPFKDVNLNYLDRLAELGDCLVGYSGHERGWHVPVAAVARGARIIEKHFTVDRELEGNDHTVSLLPDEFRTMVEQIRDV